MEMVFELNDIEETAKKFLTITNNYKVFAFSGDLGAGKTTFINALCKQLGVTETVSSPTYSIIQEYTAAEQKLVFHIDIYRIKNEEEALNAGIEDCLYSDEICMVEWPERAASIFPRETVYSTLQIVSGSERKLIIELPR